MINDSDSNDVSQNNNIVNNGNIVGRDNINNIYNPTFHIIVKDYQELLTLTQENENFALSEISKNPFISRAFNNLKEEYELILISDNPMLTDLYIKKITEAAVFQIKKQKYDKAHQLFSNALSESGPENKNYNFVLEQYLITGFIYYCQENNMNGLRSLLKKKRHFSSEDSEVDLITANIVQEICSRDTDLEGLNKSIPVLKNLYNNAPLIIKSSMANSLGLVYRRVGERTDVGLLNEAISIFKEGIEYNVDNMVMEIELKDQMSITYVRIFEFNKDENNLTEAEKLLIECLNLFKSIRDPRDLRLKPRILNNLGNVHKQKILSGDIKSAASAISCYEEAEKFWDEPNAKYEWALLQKNKAEAKYGLAKATNDCTLLLEALTDCLLSVKYRGLKNSPYQWGKSVEIIFLIVIYLGDLKSERLIPKANRRKIVSYTKEIDKDNSKWSKSICENFISHSKQTQSLLSNVA